MSLVSASISSVEQLEVLEALRGCAEAANAWCQVPPAEDRLARLMRAMALYARIHRQQPVVNSPAALLEAFQTPTSSWFPGLDDAPLLESASGESAEEPTELESAPTGPSQASPGPRQLALTEYACRILVWNDFDSSHERQAFVAGVRDHLREQGLSEADITIRYRQFRRNLILRPCLPQLEAMRLLRGTGCALADIFVAISPRQALTLPGGRRQAYLCPLCRWPMYHYIDRVACHAHRCKEQGALYSRTDSGVIRPIRALPAPDPLQVEDDDGPDLVMVHPTIWRYTVLPGIQELDLYRRIDELGVTPELWPDADRYDLHVQVGARAWRIDVKDWHWPHLLAQTLLANPPRETLIIALPDDRDWQLRGLQESCPSPSYRFASFSMLLDEIQQALEEVRP